MVVNQSHAWRDPTHRHHASRGSSAIFMPCHADGSTSMTILICPYLPLPIHHTFIDLHIDRTAGTRAVSVVQPRGFRLLGYMLGRPTYLTVYIYLGRMRKSGVKLGTRRCAATKRCDRNGRGSIYRYQRPMIAHRIGGKQAARKSSHCKVCMYIYIKRRAGSAP